MVIQVHQVHLLPVSYTHLDVYKRQGVTVEKKEGKLKGNKDVTIMDLPGIYSLSPYTLEEVDVYKRQGL